RAYQTAACQGAPVETSDVLDTIGSLVSQLKAYAAKLPAVVPMSVVPGGIKPREESIEAFEKTVYRFRTQSGASIYKRLMICLSSHWKHLSVGTCSARSSLCWLCWIISSKCSGTRRFRPVLSMR